MVVVTLSVGAGAALANGWMESRPWQFETSADKANKAGVLDLIERKKGGYYDGFSNTINNTTNIGTQVNCNNVADAKGNEAGNTQTSNSPTVDNKAGIDSTATGNASDNANDDGTGGGIANDQDNTGAITSGVDNSSTSTSSGPINVGDSKQRLKNTQTNSGDQTASVTGSTACDMSGTTVKGKVGVTGAPLN